MPSCTPRGHYPSDDVKRGRTTISISVGTPDALTEVQRRLAEDGTTLSAFVRQALRDAGYLPAPEERRDPAA